MCQLILTISNLSFVHATFPAPIEGVNFIDTTSVFFSPKNRAHPRPVLQGIGGGQPPARTGDIPAPCLPLHFLHQPQINRRIKHPVFCFKAASAAMLLCQGGNGAQTYSAALPGGQKAAVRPLPDAGIAVIHCDGQDPVRVAAPHFEEGALDSPAGGDGIFQQVPDYYAQLAVGYTPGIPGNVQADGNVDACLPRDGLIVHGCRVYKGVAAQLAGDVRRKAVQQRIQIGKGSFVLLVEEQNADRRQMVLDAVAEPFRVLLCG